MEVKVIVIEAGACVRVFEGVAGTPDAPFTDADMDSAHAMADSWADDNDKTILDDHFARGELRKWVS